MIAFSLPRPKSGLSIPDVTPTGVESGFRLIFLSPFSMNIFSFLLLHFGFTRLQKY